MTHTPLSNPAQIDDAFRTALAEMAPGGPILILGHFDADGLAATAILARALGRAGRQVETRIVGKGENPWSADLRAELAQRMGLAGLIATDLGIGEGDVVPGLPTLLIDHHVPRGTPGGAHIISGHGAVPEPTSALLAYHCAAALGPAEDFLWLAALGLIGDMAGEGFPELAEAQKIYGKTALKDAVSLVNAPRRTAAADARPALALLMECDSPKELLRGGRPETQLLHAAKAEVAAALEAARRVPPQVRGDVAMIRFASPCQIHPLVAQSWRGRLRGKIVLAVNTGYRPGWVHFAARSGSGTDLIAFLAQRRPPGAGTEYGGGHRQASGGALRPADWNNFAASIGFPDQEVSP